MLAKVVAGPGHLFMCAEWTPSIGMPRFDADGEVRRVLMDQTDLFPSTTKKNEKENKTWPSRGYARPPLGTRASTRSLFFPSSPPQPLYRAPPLPNPTSHAASAAVAPPPFARSICPASHAPQKPAEPRHHTGRNDGLLPPRRRPLLHHVAATQAGTTVSSLLPPPPMPSSSTPRRRAARSDRRRHAPGASGPTPVDVVDPSPPLRIASQTPTLAICQSLIRRIHGDKDPTRVGAEQQEQYAVADVPPRRCSG
jgi:hypothetical protein